MTSAAANAPSRSVSASSIASTPAFFSASIWSRRIFLPGCSASSLPGIGSSCADRRPTSESVDLPQDPAVLHHEFVDRVERAQDLVRAAQAERAQEHGGQELPLAVDAHVQQVLRVVLELHPRAAVRDDLRDVERLVFRVEERARRPVQLADDDALGAVDDERAVVAHQRDVAEVDLLLLDVADRLDARLGVLVPDDEPDGDLERHGERHAALLALLDVVLQLHLHGRAAQIADVAARVVGAAARRTDHGAFAVRIGDEHGAAALALGAQVLEALSAGRTCTPSCRSSTR